MLPDLISPLMTSFPSAEIKHNNKCKVITEQNLTAYPVLGTTKYSSRLIFAIKWGARCLNTWTVFIQLFPTKPTFTEGCFKLSSNKSFLANAFQTSVTRPKLLTDSVFVSFHYTRVSIIVRG